MKLKMKKMLFGWMAVTACIAFTGCGSSGIAGLGSGNSSKSEINIDFTDYKDAESICKDTTLAVRATYVDQEMNKSINYSATDEPAYFPATLYSFQVKEVLKGEYDEDTIGVPVIGGTLDGVTYSTNSDPVYFEKGEDYLLLLVTYEDRYPCLVNDSQSWYSYGHGDQASAVDAFNLEDILDALKEN